MTKILEEWTVFPHGPLVEVDDGLWTVTGELKMPLTPLQRRMTVVRLASGDLVIYSAIALGETEMGKLEAAGRPAFLIVPGKLHRLDARIWKQRYPALRVIAPLAAREAAAEVVPVDDTTVDFGDDDVRFVTVGGMSGYEAALLVRRRGGTTLVVNDIIGNMPKDSGIVLRLTHFAGAEPHVPLPIKLTLKDKAGLQDQLLAWADEPGLKRILMSHGEIIDADAAGRLRALAKTLD
ncbi:MAG TPA: hypothetical protein VMF52_07450 [Steroidobacteraceae bacterium]|nr:hypothetical protein [Steroidobacteraceae bacterium]